MTLREQIEAYFWEHYTVVGMVRTMPVTVRMLAHFRFWTFDDIETEMRALRRDWYRYSAADATLYCETQQEQETRVCIARIQSALERGTLEELKDEGWVTDELLLAAQTGYASHLRAKPNEA
jgi:hypothetical protein